MTIPLLLTGFALGCIAGLLLGAWCASACNVELRIALSTLLRIVEGDPTVDKVKAAEAARRLLLE